MARFTSFPRTLRLCRLNRMILWRNWAIVSIALNPPPASPTWLDSQSWGLGGTEFRAGEQPNRSAGLLIHSTHQAFYSIHQAFQLDLPSFQLDSPGFSTRLTKLSTRLTKLSTRLTKLFNSTRRVFYSTRRVFYSTHRAFYSTHRAFYSTQSAFPLHWLSFLTPSG